MEYEMSFSLFNDYTGKQEEYSEYFPNKRKEYIERFNTMPKESQKNWLEREIYILKKHINNTLCVIDTYTHRKDLLPHLTEWDIKYNYEPFLDGNKLLLDFLFEETSYRNREWLKLFYENDESESVGKKDDEDKNDSVHFGYQSEEYYIWQCKQQRLVETAVLLHEEKKIDYTYNDSKLADIIRKKFQFSPGIEISKGSLSSMFSRARNNNIPIDKFDFDNAKILFLEVISK